MYVSRWWKLGTLARVEANVNTLLTQRNSTRIYLLPRARQNATMTRPLFVLRSVLLIEVYARSRAAIQLHCEVWNDVLTSCLIEARTVIGHFLRLKYEYIDMKIQSKKYSSAMFVCPCRCSHSRKCLIERIHAMLLYLHSFHYRSLSFVLDLPIVGYISRLLSTCLTSVYSQISSNIVSHNNTIVL